MSTDNYLKLREIECKIAAELRCGHTRNANKLLTQTIRLVEAEEGVGKALIYGGLLYYSHQAGGELFDVFCEGFFTSARTGHGWKMTRMFQGILHDQKGWGDPAVIEFCTTRLQEMQDWKTNNPRRCTARRP